MKITPIAGNPLFNYKVNIKAADLTAAATTQTLAILPETGNNPAGLLVTRCAMNLITAFDGGAGVTLTLAVGDGGSTGRFLAAAEICVDGTEVLFKEGTAASSGFAYVVGDTIDALFTAAVNVNTFTIGEVEVYLQVADLNLLEAAGSS